jgi:bifunctional enzyme CysN/CysC
MSQLPYSARQDLLRFITCGSVDDGKSTLIGRLLYDAKAICDDHLVSLEAESQSSGTRGTDLDFALLVDGLSAEREQGITIDVAYRYFATPKRTFIVADTPGHEQYTRNMVTGASTADAAVILIDARRGVLPQTRRHSYIAHLMGIKSLVLAINKMDLVDYAQEVFDTIQQNFLAFTKDLGFTSLTTIPIVAVTGCNIASASELMPWYQGPTILEALETLPIPIAQFQEQSFAMPVQWVNRNIADFRGYAGTIAKGMVQVGSRVRILPSGVETRIERIVSMDGDLTSAIAGQSITLCLKDEVDCARGSIVTATDSAVSLADQFQANLVWMDTAKLVPGKSYWLQLATQTVSVRVRPPKHRIDINTAEHVAARTLGLNEIGVCELECNQAIAFTSFQDCKEIGGFILVDKMTHATAAAGMLNFALRRSQNVHWQALDVTGKARSAIKNQNAILIWLTGLSGAGKSTIANLLEQRLHASGLHTYVLDGDNLRNGLNRDLGFTEVDRIENIRRAGEVARLLVDAGLIVITAFISPFAAERTAIRDMMPKGTFFEVFIDAPLDVAEQRDPKGLYKKARAGKLRNFTGIDSPYEAPLKPELRIDTSTTSPEASVNAIIRLLGLNLTG